jgi:hypothetical protein
MAIKGVLIAAADEMASGWPRWKAKRSDCDCGSVFPMAFWVALVACPIGFGKAWRAT